MTRAIVVRTPTGVLAEDRQRTLAPRVSSLDGVVLGVVDS